MLVSLVLASCGGSSGSTTVSSVPPTSAAGAASSSVGAPGKSSAAARVGTSKPAAGAPGSSAGATSASAALAAGPVAGHCLQTHGAKTCGLPGDPAGLRGLDSPAMKGAVTKYTACLRASAGSRAREAKCRRELALVAFLGASGSRVASDSR